MGCVQSDGGAAGGAACCSKSLVQGPGIVHHGSCMIVTCCCSVETEVAALRAQLEQEQAVAAERQANHANALAQLEGSRWAGGTMCWLRGAGS